MGASGQCGSPEVCVSMAKLGGVCVAAILILATVVEAAPVLGPDLDNCLDPAWWGGEIEVPVHCCLVDTGKPARDYEFPTQGPMRVRQALNELSEFRLRQLERGVHLMRQLPEDDPRSWYQQFKLHCAYTAGVYEHIGGKKPGMRNAHMEVHNNWFYFPFHSWYVYFVERIIAKLVDDETFAMPYWAWDTFPGAGIPRVAANTSSPLYDPFRSVLHAPPHLSDLIVHFYKNHSAEYREVLDLMTSNNHQMYRSTFDESLIPEVFFGGRVEAGDQVENIGGPFEEGPHLAIHLWTADERRLVGEDMGQTHVSARDPLFVMHHSQVDRIWRLWQGRGGKNLDDPDFLNGQFVFFDEEGELVRVNISQSLDSEKMRVSYQEVYREWDRPEPWVGSIRERGDLKYAPMSVLNKAWRGLSEAITFSKVGNLFWDPETTTSKHLSSTGSVSTTTVVRPTSMLTRSLRSLDEFDEVLVISGVVAKPFYARAFVRIFVELPEADSSTPLDCMESSGQVHFPPYRREGEEVVTEQNFQYKVGVSKKLRNLGMSYLQSVAVTFVGYWDSQYDADITIKFTSVRIEDHKV